jgi:hypothetical protein
MLKIAKDVLMSVGKRCSQKRYIIVLNTVKQKKFGRRINYFCREYATKLYDDSIRM